MSRVTLYEMKSGFDPGYWWCTEGDPAGDEYGYPTGRTIEVELPDEPEHSRMEHDE